MTMANKDFIDGIRFAIAVMDDCMARRNCGAWIKETKKHRSERYLMNENTKGLINHLNHLAESNSLETWIDEYNNGKLWKSENIRV